MTSSQRIKGVKVDSNGEGEESGSRFRSRVRFMCSIRSMGEIGLQLEFGSASDVRVSVRSSQRIKGVIVDSNGEGEESGTRVRSRVRVMCSVRSRERYGCS